MSLSLELRSLNHLKVNSLMCGFSNILKLTIRNWNSGIVTELITKQINLSLYQISISLTINILLKLRILTSTLKFNHYIKLC